MFIFHLKMHGRVKVRTTEEEKIRKAKERQEKLKLYRCAMNKIQTKREAKEFDKELLELTGQVLTSNPDIYTLWNIRREILNCLRNNSEDDISVLYDAELCLTEHCLKHNPKSYSAWHHRMFVLTTRDDPDWKKELFLCDKYLKFDERNFHTWNYRKFVVTNCKPSLEDEFQFTTEKLYDNFSNYSAWHYRSKMLVDLYPDVEGGRPIADIHHKHELKLVQNAAFTDPDDTSAWFYQRWLLSAVKRNTQIVICKFTPELCTVAFNKQILHNRVSSKTVVYFDNVIVECEWIAVTGCVGDCLWICKPNKNPTSDINIRIEFITDINSTQTVCLEKKLEPLMFVGKSNISFQNNYSQPVIEELQKQLEACRLLLEMEPNSKWTLLTTTIFLHCIDAKQYYEESINNLNLLKNIDNLRRGYYQDLITKWNVENMLVDMYNNCGIIYDVELKFKDKITCLPFLEYFSHCESVDLSDQSLNSKILPSLVVLQHCKILHLEKNELTTLKEFPPLQLKELYLSGNNIDTKEIEIFKNKYNNCHVIFE